MQVQIDIGYEQLLKIVKKLPSGQQKNLKSELEKKEQIYKANAVLETLLLNGPTATQKQLKTVENNRKAINGLAVCDFV